MRWSAWRRTALVAGVTWLACSVEQPSRRGGFDGETRPTFQQENPYAAVDRVRWREWSEDVFASSKKPILLDISTYWCHYCHIYDHVVWGQEEFEAFVSEHFTPVRVDGDARPDLQARYGEGGLPTLVALTPDGHPIGGQGFDLEGVGPFLRAAAARYEAAGDSLRRALALTVEEIVRRQQFAQEDGTLNPALLQQVMSSASERFDRDYGGFRFVEGVPLRIVAEQTLYSLVTEVDTTAVDVDVSGFLKLTLDSMAGGAVRDHLHGGFHRAVEDRSWSQPHFEKLLEVQAWVADAYLAAFERWGDEDHREVAVETIEFVLGTLTNPDGVTWSNSIDADWGPRDDGRFYTWSIAQVDSVLTGAEAEAAKFYYGIAETGEISSDFAQNTLFEHCSMERLAAELNVDVDAARRTLESARTRMRAARLAGPRPRIDSRAFAAQNLRMATALARTARVLEHDAYRTRVLAVVDFFTDTHLDASMGVPHTYDGKTIDRLELFVNQVAAIEACLAVHELTGDATYLERAQRIRRSTAAKYRNALAGSYFDTPSDVGGVGLLATKVRSMSDNVRLAMALMEITRRTGDETGRAEAEQILSSFSESYRTRGLTAIPYAAAVHRLIWKLRGKSS